MSEEEAWNGFAVGDIVTGSVVSVVAFGAFVRVGPGIDALAPVTEWPELPAEGARVEARILDVDADRQRMALGPV